LPKQNACSVFDYGRIKNFTNTSLLADYLKVDAETVRRWRARLVKEKKPLVWSYEGVLIDFNPEQYSKNNLKEKP